MVHAEEEVEAGGVHIQHPSEVCSICAYTEIDICREYFHRSHIGRETELCTGERTVDSCRVDKTEVEVAIIGEDIIHTEIEGCGQSASVGEMSSATGNSSTALFIGWITER